MDTTTELTWMLLIFALLIAFLNHAPISDSPLVWGSAEFILIPFQLAMGIGSALPLIAPLAILALLYYKIGLLQPAVGQGFLLFIFGSAIAVLLGV